MNGISFYSSFAHDNAIWHDGSWGQSEPTSILDVIHMWEWDPHRGDIDHKFYTWIDSQPMMRLSISSDKVASLLSLWDSVICLNYPSVRPKSLCWYIVCTKGPWGAPYANLSLI